MTKRKNLKMKKVKNNSFESRFTERFSVLLFLLHFIGNFMGLGIVSVEELKNNPSQKQTITLQTRPLEKDDVSGTLTVEVNINR